MQRRPLSATLALRAACPASLAVALTFAACSGGSATVGGAPDGGAADAAASDGAPSASDASPASDASADSGRAVVVTEKPAPVCNDLAQIGESITPTTDPGPAPAPKPITSIEPGLYVETSEVHYGGTSPIQAGTSKTTTYITGSTQYYVHEDSLGLKQALNLEFKIEAGQLVRTVRCTQPPAPTGSTVTNRVGASPNGFSVYIDGLGPGNRTEVVRYERAP